MFWILCLSLLKPAHDFHVSIAQAQWSEGAIEVSLRVFSDDIEERLQKEFGEGITLEKLPNNNLLGEFLLAQFSISQNEKQLTGRFIGMEVEYDLCYFYLEFECPSQPQSLNISNKILLDSFDDQSNIVNVEVGDILRSAFLSTQKDTQKLQFN